jgi:arylsulfatase A-like enzyme
VAIRGERRDNHARTAEVNTLVLPHLEAFGDEPFFLYVHVVDPHSPYDPPEAYRGVFTDPAYAGPITSAETFKDGLRGRRLSADDVAHVRALYDEDIRYQDAMFGAFLDRFRTLGLAPHTIGVVTSDHGEEFFEHGGWQHGRRLYEEQIRVPLLFWLPSVPSLAGRRVQMPVQIIDVMPTLLSWYGLDDSAPLHGRDLAPLLVGPSPSARPVEPVYCEEIRARGYKLFSLTDGSWKLIHEVHGGREKYRLFDLDADPGEQHDLAATEPERVAAIARRLADHRKELDRPGIERGDGQVGQLHEATRKQLEALGYVEGEDGGH